MCEAGSPSRNRRLRPWPLYPEHHHAPDLSPPHSFRGDAKVLDRTPACGFCCPMGAALTCSVGAGRGATLRHEDHFTAGAGTSAIPLISGAMNPEIRECPDTEGRALGARLSELFGAGGGEIFGRGVVVRSNNEFASGSGSAGSSAGASATGALSFAASCGCTALEVDGSSADGVVVVAVSVSGLASRTDEAAGASNSCPSATEAPAADASPDLQTLPQIARASCTCHRR